MLNDRKIQDWTQAVSSLADKPQMTAAALKAAFDGNTNQVKPAFNGLIDDLIAYELDKMPHSDDIKAFRINQDNVIEVTS